MALTPTAMRRNQPNVQARDSCTAGMASSAIFRPGEKRHTNETGMDDSLVIAHASARNPTSKPSIAGRTQRKNIGCGIRTHCIKGLLQGGRRTHEPAIVWSPEFS